MLDFFRQFRKLWTNLKVKPVYSIMFEKSQTWNGMTEKIGRKQQKFSVVKRVEQFPVELVKNTKSFQNIWPQWGSSPDFRRPNLIWRHLSLH